MSTSIAPDLEALLAATNPVVRIPAMGSLPEIVLQAPTIEALVNVIQSSLDEMNRQVSSVDMEAIMKAEGATENDIASKVMAISGAVRLRGLSITHIEMLCLRATLPDLPERNIVMLHQKAKAEKHPVVKEAWELCRFSSVKSAEDDPDEDEAEGQEAGESKTVRPSMLPG